MMIISPLAPAPCYFGGGEYHLIILNEKKNFFFIYILLKKKNFFFCFWPQQSWGEACLKTHYPPSRKGHASSKKCLSHCLCKYISYSYDNNFNLF